MGKTLDLITVCYNVLLQFQHDPFRFHHLPQKRLTLTVAKVVKMVYSWYIKHLPRHLMPSNNRLRRKRSSQVDGMAVQYFLFWSGHSFHKACMQIGYKNHQGGCRGSLQQAGVICIQAQQGTQRHLILLIATSVDEI